MKKVTFWVVDLQDRRVLLETLKMEFAVDFLKVMREHVKDGIKRYDICTNECLHSYPLLGFDFNNGAFINR